MKIACKHTALHKRAAAILKAHGDTLQDAGRSDELVFLNAVVRRNLVWGTERQQKHLDAIQAEFPLSDIQMAQLDPDVNCVVIPQREQRITQPG